MIEVSNLMHAYGKKAALDQVSFKVTNGKIYGVFGAKGAGKSTLLALLAGALHPTQGHLRINGFDTVTEHRAAAKCVGYAPDSIGFYGNMTVYELLDFTADAKGVRDDRRFIHVHEIMEQTGLEPIRDRLISRLSKLDRKCLNLAQALVGSPEILLLDEPTAGLSDSESKMILELIDELAQNEKTVFLASSTPREILALCSDVILLNQGKAEVPAPLSELLNGKCYDLAVKGARAEIEELLSRVEGAISCRRLASEEKALLRYAVKGEGDGFSAALTAIFEEAGIPLEDLHEVAPSDAETALREATNPSLGARKAGDEE